MTRNNKGLDADLKVRSDLSLRGAALRPESIKVPLQILRQPRPYLEPRLALRSAAPGCRYLHNAIAGEESLHGNFEAEFKARRALDRHVLQDFAVVELERIGSVVGGNSSKPVQSEARNPRHRPLQRRRVQQPPARHVAAANDYLVSLAVVLNHPVHLCEVIGKVCHDHQHRTAFDLVEARADGPDYTSPHIVLDRDQPSFSRGDDLLQDGNGVVFVEVIDHEGPKPRADLRTDLTP